VVVIDVPGHAGRARRLWRVADGTKVYVPGYEINVVDTCGSGDAFSAGFIHEQLRGKSLAECCQLGNALGTIGRRATKQQRHPYR